MCREIKDLQPRMGSKVIFAIISLQGDSGFSGQRQKEVQPLYREGSRFGRQGGSA